MEVEQDPRYGNENPRPEEQSTVPGVPPVAAEASSRRNFLKAAVVASAAVAAAGGAAGVALVSGRQPQTIRFIGSANSGDPCDACIEGTSYSSTPRSYCTANDNTNPPIFSSTTTNCNPVSGSPTLTEGFTTNGNNNADFQIFFVDHAPVAGTINLTITVFGKSKTIDESAGVDIDSSQLFTFPPGNGNHVWVTEQTNIPAAPCMSEVSSSLGTFVKELGSSPASSLSGTGMGTAGGFAYSPATSGDDVLVQLHMNWNGGDIGTGASGQTQLFTFKFHWTDSGGTSCTKYLYIYGQQS